MPLEIDWVRHLRRMAMGGTVLLLSLALGSLYFAKQNSNASQSRHNVIIFVADGLRAGSVNQRDTPALWRVRNEGVHFANSHSLFPTFTTPNASAIGTGHGLGDTGDFANRLWAGYPVFDTGNFGQRAGTSIPGIENDQVLSDLDDHFGGNYLSETTLLTMAARSGYSVASVGKTGPTAIQQAETISPVRHEFPADRSSVIVDDLSGTPSGIPVPATITDEMKQLGVPLKEPTDDSNPNGRLQWFTDIATRVLLPGFERDFAKPFVLVVWCPEPDATQHGQGDSHQTLYPGINGESSRLAVQNADKSLGEILAWLDANPAVKARTDVFVASDHGFATISRQEIDRTGRKTVSESARHTYLNADGTIETEKGTLPTGFLAIDLALGLNTNLFDPDRRSLVGATSPYQQVRLGPDVFERPRGGSGLLGQDVKKADGSDALAIVAANGGSDLIYVPDRKPQTVREIAGLLTSLDYTGAIFVDDQFGMIPGTLPMSAIALVGSSPFPRPAIVVAFKVFYLKPGDLQTAIQISDTSFQEGQGMHGGFGRDSTFNNMAAMGPDFKVGFEDGAPVSNEDIAPTIARILSFNLPAKGKLVGRVLLEALRESDGQATFSSHLVVSAVANNRVTILHFQELNGQRYYDRACFVEVEDSVTNYRCP